jgi:antitoxin (DNA-binding transcriptional repressor) of toxin-antitoxin stability system
MRTTVHAAKTQLSRLIEKARSGEEVIIARGDTPVVRPVALAERRRSRRFGAMKGRARLGDAFFAPLPGAELRAGEK